MHGRTHTHRFMPFFKRTTNFRADLECASCETAIVLEWRDMNCALAGMMKHYVPEVTEVVEVQDDSQKVGESEFAKFEKALSA